MRTFPKACCSASAWRRLCSTGRAWFFWMNLRPDSTRLGAGSYAISSHELRKDGTSVFLNSHLLSEIEVTCDRVAFIRHGEVVRVMELSSLDVGQINVNIRAKGLSPETITGLTQWGRNIQADGENINMALSWNLRCLRSHAILWLMVRKCMLSRPNELHWRKFSLKRLERMAACEE